MPFKRKFEIIKILYFFKMKKKAIFNRKKTYFKNLIKIYFYVKN